MSLQKQQVAVNFQKGLDTKSDPWQVPLGNFLELENSVFTKQGLLQKRNGFEQIGQINDDSVCAVTTFNNELTALGSSIYAYNQPNQTFTNQGNYFPIKFSNIPLISNTATQLSVDTAVSPNGLTCVAFVEQILGNPPETKVAIVDTSTGQNVLYPFLITPSVGTVYTQNQPRVVYYQNNFIVIFAVDNGGTYSLEFISISCNSLSVSTAQVVAPTYSPGTPGEGIAFDCVTTFNGVAVGYNVAGLGFYVNYIIPGFTITTPIQIDAAHQATCVGATTDFNNSYFVYYDKATGLGHVIGVSLISGVPTAVFAPQQYVTIPLIPATVFIINVTAAVINTEITILSEVVFPLGYASLSNIAGLNSNLILERKCSTSGVLSAGPNTLFRGVGLGSKALSVLDKNYFLIVFDDGPIAKRSLQSAYFLVDTDGNIISRFAYRNGPGYLSTVLPSMNNYKYFGTTTAGSSLISNIADTSTLKVGDRVLCSSFAVNNVFIQEIVSVSSIRLTEPNLETTPGPIPVTFSNNILSVGYRRSIEDDTYNVASVISTYYRYGSFSAETELYNQSIQTAETGKNLILSGGFLWNYDGYSITENNFLIYPSQIAVEGFSLDGGSITGNLTPQSAPGEINYQYQVIYEWTDNQGNLQKSNTISVEAPIFQNVNVTGDLLIGTYTITNVSNIESLQTGMVVANASINTGSGVIASVNYATDTIVLTNTASATVVGAALTCTARTSNVLYIPTLKLSYKQNVIINIYRWNINNPIFSLVTPPFSPIVNDPNVEYIEFIDTVLDAYVVGNSAAYTTTALPNTSISCCETMTIFDNRLWVVNSEDKNILNYSKQILSTSPVEMTLDFNYFISPTQTMQGNSGPITALNVLDDKLIILKNNSLYYINGAGPDNFGVNNNYSEPILISATVGCSNPKSVVVIPNGLMMQGNKGIWLLGRDLSTSYIGAPVESFTQNAQVISGELVPGTNQARFMLSTGICLVYDYFFNQWGTFTGIPALDSTIYDGLHTFINKNGKICREKLNHYLDISNPVLMSFKTSWFAIAGIQGFQRAYFLFLLGKYYSPHKLNVELAYDFNDSFTQSTLITPDNYASVFGNDPFYGSSEFWGGPSPVEKWRIMLERQKCDSVQIKVSEIYDPTFGVTAGAGLTLSGMNFIIGVKKGYGTISQFNTAG